MYNNNINFVLLLLYLIFNKLLIICTLKQINLLLLLSNLFYVILLLKFKNCFVNAKLISKERFKYLKISCFNN